MPVAVVALAAGSFAAGAAAFAAAGSVIGMIAAGATMVGSAMTIVGTVTGNEKLTKWGAIIGIAGSLGTGLINSAASAATEAAATAGADMAGGAAANAAGDVAAGAVGDVAAKTAGDVAAKTAGDALGAGMETFAVATPPPAAAIPMDATGMINAGAPGAASAAKGVAEAASAAAPQAASASSAASNSMSTMNTASTKAGQAAAEGAAKSFDAGLTKVGQAGKIAGNADISNYIPGGIPDGAGTGMLGKIGTGLKDMSAWAKANPDLAKAALNGVSGIATALAPSAKDKALMEQYRQQNEIAARRARWGSGRI